MMPKSQRIPDWKHDNWSWNYKTTICRLSWYLLSWKWMKLRRKIKVSNQRSVDVILMVQSLWNVSLSFNLIFFLLSNPAVMHQSHNHKLDTILLTARLSFKLTQPFITSRSVSEIRLISVPIKGFFRSCRFAKWNLR